MPEKASNRYLRTDERRSTLPKVLVIGIDGGSPRLIEQWRNELPNFRRFTEEGVSGELTSTLPPWTCPAWLSFATGKNPGKLGIYGWDYIDPPNRTQLIDWSVFKLNPIWDQVANVGMKTVCVGLPLTYPPKPINGIVVSGFPAPSRKRDYTYPPELVHEIDGLVGDGYGPEPGVTNPEFMRGGIFGFLRTLNSHTEKTAVITRHLLKNYPADLFITVFVATDRVQHNLWHLMDPSHPRYKPQRHSADNPVLATYKQIDSVLGSLLEAVDKNTYVIIVSDHGFGPFHGMFYINAWLMRKGWLVLKPGIPINNKSGLLDRLLDSETAFFRMARRISAGLGLFELAKRVRGRQSGLVSPEMESFAQLYSLIDWSRTKAIGLEGDRIYLNRHIMSSEEYLKTRAEIIAGLKEIKHPVTEQPVVDAVHTWEEIYGSDALGRPPDILFVMDNYKYQQKLGLSPELWRVPFRLSGGPPTGRCVDGPRSSNKDRCQSRRPHR
jgi:predicted AlkP superfamily phosphohydrolase/phosphomutase